MLAYELPEPGFVTLVVESPDGTRIRNLVGNTPRGDMGAVLSDPTDARAVERRYYYDHNRSVVSDLSSETPVCPARRGTFRF